jgi:hypothetical protein
MKQLKFSENLIPLILSGEKTTTWRFFDDKNLQVGDELSLIDAETGKEFAKAKITAVREKKFKDLEEIDTKNHEKFKDKKEMFETYNRYYDGKITWGTTIKVINYKLI